MRLFLGTPQSGYHEIIEVLSMPSRDIWGIHVPQLIPIGHWIIWEMMRINWVGNFGGNQKAIVWVRLKTGSHVISTTDWENWQRTMGWNAIPQYVETNRDVHKQGRNIIFKQVTLEYFRWETVASTSQKLNPVPLNSPVLMLFPWVFPPAPSRPGGVAVKPGSSPIAWLCPWIAGRACARPSPETLRADGFSEPKKAWHDAEHGKQHEQNVDEPPDTAWECAANPLERDRT